MSESLNRVLVSTSMILLSKKLYRKYFKGESIVLPNGKNVNHLFRSIEIKEGGQEVDDDMFICFDSELNALGIVKVGIFGYVMPIADTSSTFINLYRPQTITRITSEETSAEYRTRIGYNIPLMERVAL